MLEIAILRRLTEEPQLKFAISFSVLPASQVHSRALAECSSSVLIGDFAAAKNMAPVRERANLAIQLPIWNRRPTGRTRRTLGMGRIAIPPNLPRLRSTVRDVDTAPRRNPATEDPC